MKIGIFIIITLFFLTGAYGQVLISENPNGTTHASAQLEVRSNQRGFLPPVMSTQKRREIANPALGFYFFEKWDGQFLNKCL